MNSRIMAIDYGDARTGVAVSDETATLVGDAWVVDMRKEPDGLAHVIVDEAAKRGVLCIIVGHPKNMDGTIGPRAEKSEQFAESLRSLCDIEVKLWDERMTTISAHRVLTDVGKFGKKRKKTVDAVAASLILESYLGSL